jgi:hypothetical protein
MNNPNPNSPVYEKCADAARTAQDNVRLIEVTLRYEVRSGGQTLERIVKVDPTRCEGVLWTGTATKEVTKFRFMSRLARQCWRQGSGRPDWVTILQRPQRKARSGSVAAETAGQEEQEQTLGTAMFAMTADADRSRDGFEELAIDSGNCYYHNGMIICC